MNLKKILFISGSIGLGHVTRDLAIVNELCKQLGDLDIWWLASEPAKSVIEKAGGKLVPEAELLGNDNAVAEGVAKGTELNIFNYTFKASGEWAKNVDVFKKIILRDHFDLIIGDETYEIGIAMIRKKLKLDIPFVIIYDFLGLDAMAWNPMELLGVYIINRIWAQDFTFISRGRNKALFVGELEDIQDKNFGLFLPNRRAYARDNYQFIGYILPFNPEEYLDKQKVRVKLGYGKEPLLICSIGGTGVGRELLEICGKAYPFIKSRIPDLRMILVGGPNLNANSVTFPLGVELRQYLPALYEHFAACDLAVVQAGGTTTLELTALRRPFIYIPQENHCEQQLTVCERLKRHRAGIGMDYSTITPESLAEIIGENIDKEVSYQKIPTDGACRAAELIGKVLTN